MSEKPHYLDILTSLDFTRFASRDTLMTGGLKDWGP